MSSGEHRQDFTRSGERYDLIVDIPGNRSWSDYKRALRPDGTYVLLGHDDFGASSGRWLGSMTTFLKLAVMSPFVPQLHLGRRSKTEDPLAVLKEFIEAGQLIPVVDRTFPLSEVPEAIGCLSQGDVEGKIVMTV